MFLKDTKDYFFNPLNKIKWGLDERSAPDLHRIPFSTPPSMECNSALSGLSHIQYPVQVRAYARSRLFPCIFFYDIGCALF